MNIDNMLKDIRKIKRKKEIGSSPIKKIEGFLYIKKKKEASNT